MFCRGDDSCFNWLTTHPVRVLDHPLVMTHPWTICSPESFFLVQTHWMICEVGRVCVSLHLTICLSNISLSKMGYFEAHQSNLKVFTEMLHTSSLPIPKCGCPNQGPVQNPSLLRKAHQLTIQLHGFVMSKPFAFFLVL